ncbi:hypothetical protein ILUMI_15257, partial [Ignelater luminosus]
MSQPEEQITTENDQSKNNENYNQAITSVLQSKQLEMTEDIQSGNEEEYDQEVVSVDQRNRNITDARKTYDVPNDLELNYEENTFTPDQPNILKDTACWVKVTRRIGGRFAQCNIASRLSYSDGSFMEWGGISTEARTLLVAVNKGVLTAKRLMHSNARSYVARIVNEYLDEVGINRMNWFEFNPIEH